jgi:hypothetical protein
LLEGRGVVSSTVQRKWRAPQVVEPLQNLLGRRGQERLDVAVVDHREALG